MSEQDVQIQYKLNLLLKKQSKPSPVLSRYSYASPGEDMPRVYSYSRTLRHFEEIKHKMGVSAMNSKVLEIFQRSSQVYERQGSPLLRPQTQDLLPRVSENTQTDDLNVRQPTRPHTEEVRQRSNAWVRKLKVQRGTLSKQKKPLMEFDQLHFEEPRFRTKEKKRRSSSSYSKSRPSSGKNYLLDVTCNAVTQPFRFTCDSYKRNRKLTYQCAKLIP